MFNNLFKNKYIVAILIVVILALVFNFFLPERYFKKPLKNFTIKVFSPISRVFFVFGKSSSTFFSGFKNLNDLSEENKEFKKELALLEMENTKLSETLNENQILREQLGLKESMKDLDLIAAEVVSFGSQNFTSEVIINKGTKNGIEEGAAVISNRYLVGKISEVMGGTAIVRFLFDPRLKVNAIVQKSRATGIVRGEIGFNIILESVPQGVELKNNDRIITSGIGGTLPKGLLIGKVEEVTSAKNDLFQEAKVKTDIDFNRLEILFVVK